MSPSPKKAPAAVVGLDIGSDSIKVAEARFAKDGVTITGLGVARTPEGAVENEVITDPQALGRAVKTLLAENGIKTRKCVSSVGGQSQVVVRVIEVPKMSREELVETMKWEIERHVPFAADEVVKDFQPLDKPNADPDAQNMEVLLAVAQQDLITHHVEALQAAGLKPMAIDVEPLAASRSLIESSQNGAMSETIAIVNIGSNRTDMGIYENGLLTFPSPPLAIAGISFTREIAEAMGQTLEQAEITKKEYAAVDLDAFAAPPDDQLDGTTGSLASEPTAFDTSFSPPAFGGGFDLGEDPSAAAQDGPADSGIAAQPAQFGDFQTTLDGPVFGEPETTGGPAFDVGGGAPAAPSGPSFDLGDYDPAAPAASAADLGHTDDALSSGPAFDLGGGDEPAPQQLAPDFDLDDTPPVPPSLSVDDAESPEFDLSDTNVHADPGQAVEQPVAAGASQAKPIEEAVFQAISSVLVDLASELRRSIEYYSSRYGKLPERVFLCGGTAKMPRLAEFLSRELGMPVEVADPMKNLKVNVPGASGQYLKEISPLFSVSIGLAIRDMIG